MDNKTAIFIIIVSLILVGVSYKVGLDTGAQKVSLEIQQTPQSPSETDLAKVLKSDVIDISAATYGTVKEVSGKTLILTRISEKGESEPFSISIKENAQIIAEYILSAEAVTEEIIGTITLENGKVISLGGKVIKLQDIKVGDSVSIVLELTPDGNYQGVSIRVSPADLFEAE